MSGLLIALVALLPGGVHTWTYERVTGKSEHQAGDRLTRLLAASALYLVVALPALPALINVARASAAGVRADFGSYVLSFGVLVVVPFVVGFTAGALTNRRHRRSRLGRLGRLIGGRGHASRAWDHLFAVQGLIGTVRVTLTDKTVLVGRWGDRVEGGKPGDPPTLSYASGYPTAQRDLYLSDVSTILFDDGSAVDDGLATLWVPAESIRYLEFYPDEGSKRKDSDVQSAAG